MGSKSEELSRITKDAPLMEQRDSLAQEVLFLPLLRVHEFGKLLKALRDKVQSALEYIKLLYFARFTLKKEIAKHRRSDWADLLSYHAGPFLEQGVKVEIRSFYKQIIPS